MSDDHQEASFQRRDPSTFAPGLVSVAHVIPVGMSALIFVNNVFSLILAIPMTGLSVWAIHAVMAGRPIGRTLTIHTPFILLVAGASLLVMSMHVSEYVNFLYGLGIFSLGLLVWGYAAAFAFPALMLLPLAPRVSALYQFLRELRFAEEVDEEEEAPLPAPRRAARPAPPRPPLSLPWQLAIAAMAMPFGIFAVMPLVNRSYYDPMELFMYSCIGVPAIMLLLLRHPVGRTLALAAPISFWIVSLLALLTLREQSFLPLAYWVNYALPTTLGLALLRPAAR